MFGPLEELSKVSYNSHLQNLYSKSDTFSGVVVGEGLWRQFFVLFHFFLLELFFLVFEINHLPCLRMVSSLK